MVAESCDFRGTGKGYCQRDMKGLSLGSHLPFSAAAHSSLGGKSGKGTGKEAECQEGFWRSGKAEGRK